MTKILINITVKEYNGKYFTILDKMKNIPVNQAIEILQIKYSEKGLFSKLCKGFNILAKDLDDILYNKNGRK